MKSADRRVGRARWGAPRVWQFACAMMSPESGPHSGDVPASGEPVDEDGDAAEGDERGWAGVAGVS